MAMVPASNIKAGFHFIVEEGGGRIRAVSDIARGRCKKTRQRLDNSQGCVLVNSGKSCIHLGWDQQVRGVSVR